MFISIISKINAQMIQDDEPGTVPYVWIGEIEPINFEQAFELFNDGRAAHLGYDLPSMSVGDIVTLGGETKQVASVGFIDLDPPEPCGYCRRCSLHDDPGGCLEVYDWELRTMGIRKEQ